MPSPPKILDTNIQFKDPITLTTTPAIVRMNVPFRKDSPIVAFFSIINTASKKDRNFAKKLFHIYNYSNR